MTSPDWSVAPDHTARGACGGHCSKSLCCLRVPSFQAVVINPPVADPRPHRSPARERAHEAARLTGDKSGGRWGAAGGCAHSGRVVELVDTSWRQGSDRRHPGLGYGPRCRFESCRALHHRSRLCTLTRLTRPSTISPTRRYVRSSIVAVQTHRRVPRPCGDKPVRTLFRVHTEGIRRVTHKPGSGEGVTPGAAPRDARVRGSVPGCDSKAGPDHPTRAG